jgi:hypothetical protein
VGEERAWVWLRIECHLEPIDQQSENGTTEGTAEEIAVEDEEELRIADVAYPGAERLSTKQVTQPSSWPN